MWEIGFSTWEAHHFCYARRTLSFLFEYEDVLLLSFFQANWPFSNVKIFLHSSPLFSLQEATILYLHLSTKNHRKQNQNTRIKSTRSRRHVLKKHYSLRFPQSKVVQLQKLYVS